MRSVFSQLLNTFYEVQDKLTTEYAAFESYCSSVSSIITEDISTYNELIEDSDLLVSTYRPLMEEDQEELSAIQSEVAQKNMELEDGQATRKSEALESQATITAFDQDISTVDSLLLDLSTAGHVSLSQVFEKVHSINSEVAMTQHIQSTLVSLTDSESGIISSETRDLLVSLVTQLATEILSMKELEEQSEEAAQTSWEELESMLEDRVSQLNIRSSELSFQVDMFSILIEDNETQISMYNSRIETLNELIEHVESGCSSQISSYQLESESM